MPLVIDGYPVSQSTILRYITEQKLKIKIRTDCLIIQMVDPQMTGNLKEEQERISSQFTLHHLTDF